ncbi:probable tyrosyl-DNA phosphodiesterase [Hetaerina americana]|uniref:probable tyrosyl-DNA phosphodiesterase n=1 Tax=Hetaerina americana TaxID=62018 RepID=UPI003A7F3242
MSANRGRSRPCISNKECNYGEDCFRRNPVHFKEFCHPHLEALLVGQKGDDISLPRGYKSSMDSSVIIEQLKILSSIKAEMKLLPAKDLGNNTDNTKEESRKTAKESQSQRYSDPSGTKIRTSQESVGIVSNTSELETQKKKLHLAVDLENKKRSPPKATPTSPDKVEPEIKKRRTDVNIRGTFMEKWESSQPYNFFLTAITDSPRTHAEKLTVKFKDLLDSSLGTVESSLQINFMVELEWLLGHYERAGIRTKPLLIMYGVEDPPLKDKRLLGENIKACHVKPPHPFGHHHTKMSIFKYTDGSVRVIVSTANLIESDWDNRTQGVWIGPRCMPLPTGANTNDGESTTNFRTDLVRYLSAYRLSILQEWIGTLRKIDFSPVRVCFVGSVPGSHKAPDFRHWGHMKAGQLLRTHCSRVCRNESGSERDMNPWPLVIQCSSIGSLGANSSAWVCGEFRSSLSETTGATLGTVPNLKQPSVKVVYPSLKNVAQSHDGLLGGGCLPYSMKTHVKQEWLTDYLHHWRSEERYRSRAVPHIKSYLRWSPGQGGGIKGAQLAWFILTSANLSKAAWGSLNKAGSSLYIMSYEAGVLFLPRFFKSEEGEKNGLQTFPLSVESGHKLPPFPIPYDLPLTPYGPGDKVWTMENLM